MHMVCMYTYTQSNWYYCTLIWSIRKGPGGETNAASLFLLNNLLRGDMTMKDSSMYCQLYFFPMGLLFRKATE